MTYFALKELVVCSNQLLFLCCFSNIFDVTQQLVLIEKLEEKKNAVKVDKDDE